MPLALGIDLGTSSAKGVVLDAEGEVLAEASTAYRFHSPRPGWAEQDPSDWWRALCATTRKLLRDLAGRSPALPAREVRGVALSGQMNGAVLTNGAGNPLAPAILWLDRRSQPECAAANERAGDLLRERALHVLNPVNTLAKLLWLRAHAPELYREAERALLPKDWINQRLTGVFASDVSDASATAMLDLYRRDWCGELLDRLELRRDLLPPVFESPTLIGGVTEAAAEETGLAAGTPVCAGGADMSCMAVGGGVIRPGVVSAGIGTAAHAVAFSTEVSDAGFNQLWPMCHAVPGAYYWLGCSFTGGASFAWLRDWLGGSFEELTAEAAQAPPGCEGLIFMPWLEGTATPHPDASARGGWIGLGLHHRRAHLVRAVLEGVAYDLRHSLEGFRRVGLPVTELRLGEGGARSPLWRQIQADIFGQDARVLETEDASALGAAVIAGVGSGVFPDYTTACGRAVRLAGTVRHDPARAAFHEGGYRRYGALYPALRPWFHGEEPRG